MLVRGIGTGNAHAGYRRFNVRVYLAHLHAGRLERSVHLPARFNGKEYHKRYHRKNYQRKVEIYVCKHYKRTYQRYAGYERILRPVVRQLRYFKQVVHKAAHYRAGLVFVKEGEGQLLKMAEHVAPHISLYPYAHDMAPILNYIVQRRLYKIYPKQHARPNQQQPELLIGNIYVGYVFGYHRVKKIAYGDH